MQRVAVIASLTSIMLLITLLTQGGDKLAFACTCSEPKSPLASLDHADAVFSGEVIEVEETHDRFPARLIKIDVHTVWKGITRDSISISTAIGDGACGYEFDVGQYYLIYAYGDPEDNVTNLDTNYCTRTAPLDKAEADLVALGEGDITFAAEEAVVVLRTTNPFTFLYIVGIAAFVVGAILIIKRKKSAI